MILQQLKWLGILHFTTLCLITYHNYKKTVINCINTNYCLKLTTGVCWLAKIQYDDNKIKCKEKSATQLISADTQAALTSRVHLIRERKRRNTDNAIAS